MDAILVVNAGSSSLKFQVFGIENARLVRQVRGQIGGIGTRPRLQAKGADGDVLVDQSYARKPFATFRPPSRQHATGC